MLKRICRLIKGDASKKKSCSCLIIALFFYLFFSFTCQAESGPPEIKNVLLAQCQTELCLNFSLNGGLTQNIEKILQSGIPVKYIFEISLKRKRLLWDDELKHIELIRTILLDNIRNEYILTFYYPTTRIITVSNIDEAKQYLFYIKQLPLIPLKALKKGDRYFINIKARARKGETSMPFGRLVKMFSSFGFSTKSYEIEFRY